MNWFPFAVRPMRDLYYSRVNLEKNEKNIHNIRNFVISIYRERSTLHITN